MLDQIRAFLDKNSLPLEGDLYPDGRLHRYHKRGRPFGSRDVSMIIHADRSPRVWVRDHSTGFQTVWKVGGGATLTPEEKETLRAACEARRAEIEAGHVKAKANAEVLWKYTSLVGPGRDGSLNDAGYLSDKGIMPHGVRGVMASTRWPDDLANWMDGQGIMVPMYGADGDLWNVQIIRGGGKKAFLPGGRAAGLFYCLPDFTGDPETVRICEGFSTAATVQEMHSGEPTIVVTAFCAGNLAAVAEIMHDRYPLADIIIMADNDRFTAGNPGLTQGRKAAELVGGTVEYPEFPPSVEGTDWNDWRRFRTYGPAYNDPDFTYQSKWKKGDRK